MCGRYGLFAELDNLAEELGFPPQPARSGYRRSWNIALPASIIVVSAPTGEREAGMKHWGISLAGLGLPPSILLFNARGETLSERPTFRSAFESRRCLIPANRFYEWREALRAASPRVGPSGGRTAIRICRTVWTRLGCHCYRRRQLAHASDTRSDVSNPVAG